MTPSIVYAGHPRYSKIEKVDKIYIQIVLQIRVKKGMFKKKPGTVENTFPNIKEQIDLNYQNHELEWVFKWNDIDLVKPKDGILVYGIMARIS